METKQLLITGSRPERRINQEAGLLFTVIVMLAGLVHAGPRLTADWAAFQAEGDSNRVEFFYAVPYGLLEYSQANDGLEANFAVRFVMSGEDYEQDAMLYRRGAIPSFREAEETGRVFVDGFSLLAPPGRYALRVSLFKADMTTTDKPVLTELDVRDDSITVPAFSGRPDLSTLQLASGVIHDTVTGGFSVVPNPGRVYGTDGLERVYFYYEGYGLSAAADSYDLVTSVIRTDHRGIAADTLITSPQTRYKGDRERVSAALGVSVAGFDPGQHRLTVSLTDRATGSHAARSAAFTIVGEEEPFEGVVYRLDLTPLEEKHYEQIEYIATRSELSQYEALSDSGKEVFLARFWSRHNLAEFARRMETARERYRAPGTDGLKTDRGRIYVKYGEPDEIDRRVMEIDRRPREYWRYYSRGYTFVFIDITGTGNYRLAWTNSPQEPRTGLEGLLTVDEQEMFR